ncbi:cytochrome P450 [Kribbella sp. NPDC050820]|uniref:cytochrome P450 n=1 Tax=Kribbella sp. NPDC050820 TaxID=3155408 RepID=UPI0033DAF87C
MTTSPTPDDRQSGPVRLPTERECPFDPPTELGRLRDSQPLSRVRFLDGRVGWLVTSYELVRAVLGDARFSIVPGGNQTKHPELMAAGRFAAMRHDAAVPDSVRALVERYRKDGRLADAFRDPEVVRAVHEYPVSGFSFGFTPQPVHTRMRRLLTGHFSGRSIGGHRADIEQIVADRLDAMERVGPPVDLVEMFAHAVPLLVVRALFGLQDSEHDTFLRLGQRRSDPSSTVDEVLEVSEERFALLRELMERKRTRPGTDLLSTLAQAGEMTDDWLDSTAGLLIGTALDTVATNLAFGVLTLLQDRDRWNALRTGSVPIGQIVEELLRYTAMVQDTNVRTALEDVELGGTVIKAFERVAVSLPAANRDPQVFAEPDRFDMTRQAAKHVAFGFGVHQCLGQHLARLELQVALTGLAQRFPTLDLAVPMADIPWPDDYRTFYGPQRIPVTW